MSRNRLFAAVVSVVALGGGLLSCQTYEVDPVKPATAKVQDKPTVVAQQLSPNVVIVVDRSGSMADSPDETQINICPNAGQQNIGCKWDELLSAMLGGGGTNGFVSDLVSKAGASDPVRLGLVTFGGSSSTNTDSCSPGVLQVPVTAATSSVVQSIGDTLNGIPPNGGTPTAASLAVARDALVAAQQADTAAGVSRKSYVVLLTDGAPNCNGNFQATPQNCTDGTQYCVSPGGCLTSSGSPQNAAPKGCLDKDNTISTVDSLSKQNGISTFVIGFGADFTDPSNLANQTLEGMAISGNTRRVDGNGQPVEPAFYRATSQQDLTDALNAIIAAISNKCQYTLDSTPPSASAVEVIVTQGGTSTILNANQYTVQGNNVTITDTTVCGQLNSATQSNPATVDFKYLGQ